MSNKNFLFFLAWILFPFQSFAQNNCDCDEAQKQKTGFRRNYESGNFDSATYFTSQVRDNKNGICDAFYYSWSSLIAISKKEYNPARTNLDAEYKILKKMKCPERLARHYSNYALLYNYLNKQDSAVDVSLKALKIAEEAQLASEQIRICANLGALFNQLGQHEKSMVFNKKGVAVARIAKDTTSLAMILNQLANNYLIVSQLTEKTIYADSAYEAASEGLIYAKKTNALFYILEAYGNISMSFSLKKDYTNCIQFADSIILIAPTNSNYFNRNISIAYTQKSDSYYELKNYLLSREMADSALHYAELFNIQMAIDPLDLIYLSSKELKDFEKALWAYERMAHIKDSLFTLDKNAAIAELDGKYNQEKNQRRIEKLNEQNRFYIIVAIAALLLVISIAFYVRQQSLKHKQKNLETEQRLNRARINPHFFFNVLTSLQFLAAKEENKKKLISSFFSFSKLMRQTLESSYDEFGTVEAEKEFIEHYMQLQELKRSGLFEYKVEVSSEIDISCVQIPTMIIQPFIENSIEHGFSSMDSGGIIEIKFIKNKNELIIVIIDNGVGISNAKADKVSHISRATQITSDRLFLLNKKWGAKATFYIENNNPKGTKVTIHLPYFSSANSK